MNKKTKIITLVSIIVIVAITIHSSFNFIFIPNKQKKRIIKNFTENSNKFKNVHNYMTKTYPLSRCYKKEGGKVYIYSRTFDKNGNSKHVEVDIKDDMVLKQIEYILYDLDFEYIDNLFNNTSFVFRDINNHYQSIGYTTKDTTELKGWGSIKIDDNWYYQSLWKLDYISVA